MYKNKFWMKPTGNAVFTKGFAANELLLSTQKCESSQVVDKNWVYCQTRVCEQIWTVSRAVILVFIILKQAKPFVHVRC